TSASSPSRSSGRATSRSFPTWPTDDFRSSARARARPDSGARGACLRAALGRARRRARGVDPVRGPLPPAIRRRAPRARRPRAAIGKWLPGLVLAGCVLHAALVVYAFGGAAPLEEGEMSATPFSRFATPLAAAALFVPAGLVAAVGPPEAAPAAVDVLLPLVA